MGLELGGTKKKEKKEKIPLCESVGHQPLRGRCPTTSCYLKLKRLGFFSQMKASDESDSEFAPSDTSCLSESECDEDVEEKTEYSWQQFDEQQIFVGRAISIKDLVKNLQTV